MTDEKERRVQELIRKINLYAIGLQKDGYKPFEIAGALSAVGALLVEDLTHKDAAIKYLESIIQSIRDGSGPTLN